VLQCVAVCCSVLLWSAFSSAEPSVVGVDKVGWPAVRARYHTYVQP